MWPLTRTAVQQTDVEAAYARTAEYCTCELKRICSKACALHCVCIPQIQFGWCRDADNRVDPLWSEACDVTSPLFGTRSLIIDLKTKALRLPDGSEAVDAFQVRVLLSATYDGSVPCTSCLYRSLH